MNHLKEIGQHEDRDYLNVFRLNVLHAVHAKEGQHVATVEGVLKDTQSADRMLTKIETVDTKTALHALDRVRQLFHCNKRLCGEIYFRVLTYLSAAVDAIALAEVQQDWPSSAAEHAKGENIKMGRALIEAVGRDQEFLKKKYPDQSWGHRASFSETEALQKASDFRSNFMTPELSHESVESLLEEGCSLNVMIDWLRGLHTLYRSHAATNLDIEPNYRLFIAPCYNVYNDETKGVFLNKRTVHIHWAEENPEAVRLIIEDGNKVWFDAPDWLGMTSISNRDSWLQTFIAHDMFDLAHYWITEWYEVPLSGLTVKGLTQYQHGDALLDYVKNQRPKEYSQAQFDQMIYELTGSHTDLVSGARPDTEIADDLRAKSKRPFLEGSDEAPAEMHPTRRRFVPVETHSKNYAPKGKKAQAEEESNMNGIFIALLAGIAAFAMTR